jgi:acyl-[acyl-carrier-protein]-phospholipid O-acyltransferase/long-chain-fatty-acid--[acyl-carrier-protein] ligase
MFSEPFDAGPTRTTLFGALLAARDRFGKNKVAVEDLERQPITYGRLVLGALVLGRKLAAMTAPRERVGVLLPNVQALPVVLFALNARGRIPAMLNFTAGIKNLRAACETAGLKTILTSRRFVDQGKLEDVVAAIGEGRSIVYLEDVRATITSLDKILGVLESLRAGAVARSSGLGPDDPGVILFTSGSEGAPKGVVLSNANILANAGQIAQHAIGALSPADTLFNPLPAFHSFGLTAGMLLGLLHGMKVVLYPSPLHYRQVPKLVGGTGSTILFATDTFLQGYARAAGEGDLDSVRYVIAGAERVKDETRRLWAKWGTEILEGYGATECSPVIAVNQPDDNHPGSVGRLLPGLEARLEPVPGIEEGGRLFVRGPNVMTGYLGPTPDSIDRLPGGWHDTGDVVTLDEHGVVRVRGRVKRFAKIGGEMVSLTAVEDIVSEVWPGRRHAVISIPDERKGERLVLVTDCPEADVGSIAAWCRRTGAPEIAVPKRILKVDEVPVLGSGKVDYGAIQQMADSQGEAAA